MKQIKYEFNRTPCNVPGDIPEGTKVLVLHPDIYYTDHGYPENGTTGYNFCRVEAFPCKEDAVKYVQAEMTSYSSKEVSKFRVIELTSILTPNKKVTLDL